MAETGKEPGRFQEIGVSGLKVFGGFVNEEFLQDLNGDRGRRKLREMGDNDATIGAVLNAISLILRSVVWEAVPAEDAPEDQAQAEADFVASLFEDMSHTWDDFLTEVLSFLVFGWSYHEIVLKRRVGPYEKNPERRSNFTDGRIGIRKLPIRAQETLLRWEIQPDGGVAGLWQVPPQGGPTRYVPIERALLFRTVSRKNNPEGVSILRHAYESWYFLRHIRPVEATGIERELAGLPVISIPSKYLTSTVAEDIAVRQEYEKIARDLKFNEQGGLVVPSDMYPDADGNPSSAPLVKVDLIKGAGQRAIDTTAVKQGYKQDIANSVLAGFILLGNEGGSYAMSKDKSSFFIRACEAILARIESVINRFLIPRIWDLNGLDRALMPEYRPGRLAAPDLAALGAYVQQLASAGAPLFPDTDLENRLREDADLPPVSPEAMEYREEDMQAAKDAAAAALAVAIQPAGADEDDPQNELTAKAGAQALYVSRDVLNADEIRAWASSQGIKAALPANDMHVTVTYSKTPVKWMDMGEGVASVEVAAGGPRIVELFGADENVLVLTFVSKQLAMRHDEMCAAGASWDWPEYQPHITITYQTDGIDVSSIDPYAGRILLGPEKFRPINDDWQGEVKEEPTG